METKKYYNSNYTLTYHNCEDNDIGDTQYRKEFLKVFNLKEYDDKELDKAMVILYNKVKDNTSFKNIFEAASKQKHLAWLIRDDLSKLYVLFNFDLFHLFHNCLQDFFKYKDIMEENYNTIMLLLKK